MATRPTGTVTFLFTDIEESTRRWEDQPEEMRMALTAHDAVLRETIEANGGWLFKHTGDGVIAAFAAAQAAIEAATEAQRRLELPVRMGICTGEVEQRGDDYFGPALNRAARTMAAGHGGQVLAAASTAAIVEGIDLIDLGFYRLRDLSQPQRLYQVTAEGLRERFPPLKTLDTAPGNLPARATSFLGRDEDLAKVAAVVRTARLVTLTGVGGVGKTRLALQLAADISPEYPDGAWLVELAAVGDPAATAHVIAGVLGVAQQPGKTIEESVVASLSGRHLLLVLDNCEHLIDAVAALASEILAQCPRVTVLASSREALMIEGEQTWPVPSLGYRDGITSAAVRLFIERARAVVPGFALDADADAVAEICRRLDGIPLAIELAAARVRTMTPAQIRDRLDERFRLLTGGSRRALERHQTLRNAVQWSFDLLSAAERAVLARCSVFAGGFSLEAAESVGAGGDVAHDNILDLLDSLARKSLIIAERSGETMRYGLLETIRQFGEEHLSAMGELGPARRCHAQFYAQDSEIHFRIWRSPQTVVAHRWVEREMDNLRAAFRWAMDHEEVDLAVRLNISDMGRFVLREEAAGWAAETIDAARRARHPRLTVLLTWATSCAWGLGRLDDAKRYGEEAISLARDPDFEPYPWAYGDLAFVAGYEGDLDRALTLVQEGAALDADHEHRLCLAHIPYFLAISGRRQEAMAATADIIATVEEAGLPLAILTAHYSKGHAFSEADPPTALAAFERVVAIARDSGNRMFETVAIPEIAMLQARSGDVINALHSFRMMLDAWQGAAELLLISHGIGQLVVLFERLGRHAAAAVLHGAVVRRYPSNPFVQGLPETTRRVRKALGDARFKDARRGGAAMALHEAVEYAQEQIRQALAELDRAGR